MSIQPGLVFLVNSNQIGAGNPELGLLLMTKWFNLMIESEKWPERIILMNSGVLLTKRDSPVYEALFFLERQGVKINPCGTCVSFFQIDEQIAVGSIGNMKDAQQALMSAQQIIPLS